ncbi:hypothetical protein MC885_015413 [Smutsia gigantea]|nr:hypothetical protein MC885_015413 [Smutsia gigantea]
MAAKKKCSTGNYKQTPSDCRAEESAYGYTGSEKEKLIDSLSKKINQVYKACIGDTEVGVLNPVQKLVKVESRLVELSDLIDSIPKENVEATERIKQKEQRRNQQGYFGLRFKRRRGEREGSAPRRAPALKGAGDRVRGASRG